MVGGHRGPAPDLVPTAEGAEVVEEGEEQGDRHLLTVPATDRTRVRRDVTDLRLTLHAGPDLVLAKTIGTMENGCCIYSISFDPLFLKD